MSHPSERQLAAYRTRTLDPAELVTVDLHLASCPACRAACTDPDLPVRAAALVDSLTAVDREHPSAEELAAFAVARLDRDAGDRVAAHLELCDDCAEVATEVRAEFRQVTAPPVSIATVADDPSRRSAYTFTRLAAAATVLLVVGSAAFWFASRSTPETPASATTVPGPSEPAARVSIVDRSRVVALTATGEVRGLDAVPASLQQLLASALSTKTMPLPAALEELGARQGHLLSDDTETAPASLVSPVGTFVSESRPLFEWMSTANAQGVRVEIYGSGFVLLTESEWLTTTRWAPPIDLPGGTYSWQLTVRTRGGETFVPKPPAPQARFRVLDAEGRTRLDEELRSAADSGVARAIVFARAGLIGNAERELVSLQKANPQSEEIAAFLAQLRRPISR